MPIPINFLLASPAADVSPPASPPASNLSGYWGPISGNTGHGQLYAPIIFNGNLWELAQSVSNVSTDFTPAGGIYALKSPFPGPLGPFSFAIQDGANGPSRTPASITPWGAAVYDGAAKFTVAWSVTANSTGHVQGPISLKDFNLNTGTWGATYGTAGAPNAYVVNCCFLRPGGNLLVLYNDNLTGGLLLGLTAGAYSGAWTTFPIDTNVPGGFQAATFCTGVMDSTGRVHAFFAVQDISGNQQWFYQAIETTNTLGHFAVLLNPATNIDRAWQPIISGNNILLGVLDPTSSYPTIISGTPLSNPVFTTLGTPGIDTGVPPVGGGVGRLFSPVLVASPNGTIYALYLYQDLTSDDYVIRATATTDPRGLSGWQTGLQIFNAAASSNPNFDPTELDFLGTSFSGGYGLASFVTSTNPAVGNPSSFFFAGSFASFFAATSVQGIDANGVTVVALPDPQRCGPQ